MLPERTPLLVLFAPEAARGVQAAPVVAVALIRAVQGVRPIAGPVRSVSMWGVVSAARTAAVQDRVATLWQE